MGSEQDELPTPPERPTCPATDLSGLSGAFKRFLYKQTEFNRYKHWNKEALTALECRFPKCLTPKRNKLKALPLNFTIREGMDYVEELASSDTEQREAYCKLLMTVTTRDYVPNPDGPVEFFANMASDKHSIDVLNCGEMPYSPLMVHCTVALRQSGVPKKEMRRLDDEWKLQKKTMTDGHSPEEEWIDYIDFHSVNTTSRVLPTKMLKNFYVVLMNQPTYTSKDRWSCFKYRLVVSVRDKKREERCKSDIEFSHTPLRQVSKRVTRGFGKILHDNAIASKITNNDCWSGVNFGAMVASGTYCTNDGELVTYANTTDLFHKLEELGENYFKKHGFGEAVMNRKNGIGKDLLKASKMFRPWFTLSVTSVNYGNECHIDPNDAAPAITIWHERVVPPEVLEWDPSANIKNWYFLF